MRLSEVQKTQFWNWMIFKNLRYFTIYKTVSFPKKKIDFKTSDLLNVCDKTCGKVRASVPNTLFFTHKINSKKVKK